MKCQHCGKNEATFYYKSTINGQTTEARVCQNCAEELGYARALQSMGQRGRRMFREPFGLWGDAFFDTFASHLLTEFPAPGNTLEEARETVEKKEKSILTAEESRAFDLQRQRNALQHQLREAIDTENYEEAARLRDQIRALPGE